MKKQLLTAMMLMAAMSLLTLSNPVFAQAGGNHWGNGPGEFIDENGDGFNDLAPDDDGDGIPNGLDEDYIPPQDGSGAGFGGNGNGQGNGPGDGSGNGAGQGNGNGHGHGHGPGNGGYGPGDGSGNCIIEPEASAQPQVKILPAR